MQRKRPSIHPVNFKKNAVYIIVNSFMSILIPLTLFMSDFLRICVKNELGNTDM